ncbi:hypothetical protein EV177_003695 [Coemansia sp. RSA 1804]|nr:hypothetical protein EV177_003695 [Coemansia sp. RSA 1804]
MSNEKSEGYTISLGRFPELHADIEAGLLKDGQPQPQQEQRAGPQPEAPRRTGFKMFVRRMVVRVLSVFAAILLLNLALSMTFAVLRNLRFNNHNHNHHGLRPSHWHEHHYSPVRPYHYPPHLPYHHPPPPSPPPYYGGYYDYTPYRPEYGYGYGRPYPEYNAYRPGSRYNHNYDHRYNAHVSPYRPEHGYGNRRPYPEHSVYRPGSRYSPGHTAHSVTPYRPELFQAYSHHNKPQAQSNANRLVSSSASGASKHAAHRKPLFEGSTTRRTKQNSNYVDRESLSTLISGQLPLSKLGSLFRTTGNACIPVVPVDGIEPFVFDPTENSSIVQTVVGAIGSHISIVPTTDSKASFTARVMASTQDIADKISLKMATSNEGRISFTLDGPKFIGKNECAYAIIELKIPEAVASLISLRTNYVYGKFELDRSIARKIAFDEFAVAAVIGPITTPPIHANNVDINLVSGNVHGFYRISNSISVNTARGDIDAGVNVSAAKKSAISAGAVSGSVALRVAGGFEGSFSATTISGKAAVEDASDGSSRLRFDKDGNRSKKGTFGPEDAVNPGASSLRAVAVNGNVSVEFD